MNNPDNWDLEDSLDRVGTVAKNKFIEWWRGLNEKHGPADLYDMAIRLYFENQHPTPQEPLAVIAEKKGVSIEITPPSFYVKPGEPWGIGIAEPSKGLFTPLEGETYAEAESKAREFLSKLDYKKLRGKK